MTESRQSPSDTQQTRSTGARSGGANGGSSTSQRSSSSPETKSKGQETGSQAQEQVSKAAGQAQEQVGKLAGVAQEQVTNQLASQKTRAADTLGVLAAALHTASNEVRDADEAQIADYIKTAAGQIDRVATALREQDVMQLLRSAEDVARRQPELFLAATFALGFAATRFLRSSSPSSGNSWSRSSYGDSSNRSSYGGMAGGYGSSAYGQGYAGYGTSMGSGQSMETGSGSGYGGQMNAGYASGLGLSTDRGAGKPAQGGVEASSGASSNAAGWQSGLTIDTGPEER